MTSRWASRRDRFRQVIGGDACIHPGSVSDPLSARMAEDLGFEVGMFAGSVASMAARVRDPARIASESRQIVQGACFSVRL